LILQDKIHDEHFSLVVFSLGTIEIVVELSNQETNTNKTVNDKVVEKKQTESSRTVKPPSRKQKNKQMKSYVSINFFWHV